MRINTDFSRRADGLIERYFRARVQTQILDSDFAEGGALYLVRTGDISASTLSRVVGEFSLFKSLER